MIGFLVRVPYWSSLIGFLIQVPYSCFLFTFLISGLLLRVFVWVFIQVPYLGSLFLFLTQVPYLASSLGSFGSLGSLLASLIKLGAGESVLCSFDSSCKAGWKTVLLLPLLGITRSPARGYPGSKIWVLFVSTMYRVIMATANRIYLKIRIFEFIKDVLRMRFITIIIGGSSVISKQWLDHFYDFFSVTKFSTED